MEQHLCVESRHKQARVQCCRTTFLAARLLPIVLLGDRKSGTILAAAG